MSNIGEGLLLMIYVVDAFGGLVAPGAEARSRCSSARGTARSSRNASLMQKWQG